MPSLGTLAFTVHTPLCSALAIPALTLQTAGVAEVRLTVLPELAVARNTTSVPSRVSLGVSKLMLWINKLLLAIGPTTEDKLPWLSSITKYM